ncbi:MAG: hypothetical protein CL566_01960 [Alphaproteobacteria bacterium]|nr:hypothetical protein [Alphaproteobacteria bacterium]|tara:strand:+ start:88 stop:573 length:486 start_codon:yes stop_codon:yes gene_type:complete
MSEARADARPATIELRIIVWQLVRIMVQLESVARNRGRKKAPSVYADWRASWTEIDRTLTRLGDSDSEAFSDLMMNQEVVLRCRDRSQLNEVTRAIENVINQLDQHLRAAKGDAQQEEDLQFERREMNALLKRLRKLGRAGSRGKPGEGANRPRRARGRKD